MKSKEATLMNVMYPILQGVFTARELSIAFNILCQVRDQV
jgi:hypothetical protein